jgi:hypothetical protein
MLKLIYKPWGILAGVVGGAVSFEKATGTWPA